MGADEEGTHERLKAHLSELVEPKIAKWTLSQLLGCEWVVDRAAARKR